MPTDALAIAGHFAEIVRTPTHHVFTQQIFDDGDQARMDLGREKLAVYKEGAEETPVITATGSFGKAAEDHVANFLQCVRTRAMPNATVEKGFQAALVVQLANMSLRQGRRMKWNAALRRVEV